MTATRYRVLFVRTIDDDDNTYYTNDHDDDKTYDTLDDDDDDDDSSSSDDSSLPRTLPDKIRLGRKSLSVAEDLTVNSYARQRGDRGENWRQQEHVMDSKDDSCAYSDCTGNDSNKYAEYTTRT